MAKKLENKTNTPSPTSKYPYSRIQDEIQGTQPGTPVNREVYNSVHQTLERAMDWADITHNGSEDNAVDGFQYFEAIMSALDAQNAKYNARFRKVLSRIGSGDLTEPYSCAVHERNEHLYVSEISSGNERIFCFDLNDGSRVTSQEFGGGLKVTGMHIQGDTMRYAYLDTTQSTAYISIASINLLTLSTDYDNKVPWSSSEIVDDFGHYPDIHPDPSSTRVFVSKGDAVDATSSGNYNTEIRVYDEFADAFQSTEKVTGPIDDAFFRIHVDGYSRLLTTTLFRGSIVEIYDFSDRSSTDSSKVQSNTINSSSPGSFANISGKLVFPTSIQTSGDRDGLTVFDGHKNPIENIPGHRLYMPNELITTSQEGRSSSYIYPTTDANGERNYKLFVPNQGNGYITVVGK